MSAYAVKQVSHEMLATCDRLAANGCAGTIAKDIQRFVGRLGQRLAKPLRIVVLGEFNAGKSTLVNTLIGSELLPTSIHANTRVPILVHYTSKPQLSFEANDRSLQPISLSAVGDLRYGTARMLRVGLPVDRLKSLELVDTPGLATGSARLDELAIEACRRSNLAIWCTVAAQAWKATEQATWLELPKRLRASSVLAVTHADTIPVANDLQRLRMRLTEEARPHFAAVSLIAVQQAGRSDETPRAEDIKQRLIGMGGTVELEAALVELVSREMTKRRVGAQKLLERFDARLASAAGLQPAPHTAAVVSRDIPQAQPADQPVTSAAA